MAKILVVDDEECIRFTLGHFIAEAGYDVVCASDYDEAKRTVTQEEFDLVIADIVLGGKTGIDLLRECRKLGKGFPVVLITGYANVATAAEAVRLGAFDYLSKPVEWESLMQIIAAALESGMAAKEKELLNLRNETILRSLEETIVTVDDRFVVTEIGGCAKRLCGFGPEAVGKDARHLDTECARRCLKPLEETMETHRSIRSYCFECRRDGDNARVLSASSYPLLDDSGRYSGAVMIVRDEPPFTDQGGSSECRSSMYRLLGKSEKMQGVYSIIDSLLNVDSSVLVVGESGTGKELVAETLHFLGNRSKRPLVKVNCSALSESLMESELFGHVRGAFTGAATDRVGRFQKADGGTIFLDEIGDLSPRVQSSLLRVLQQREFERVGDSNPIRVDIRVVAATNKDLEQMVKRGEYREDLLYRLKVVEIRMPPLRERLEDIPLFVEHFLAELNHRMKKRIVSVSSDVDRRFQEYAWPGNVRELEHALEHAFVLCNTNVIMLDHLPAHLKLPILVPTRSHPARHIIESSEILKVLEKTAWNKKRAAKILGIDRKTLYRNMAKYGISGSAVAPA